MEENLKYYLENTIVSKAAIESRLTHPFTKVRYPVRTVYALLRKYADDFLALGSEPRCISLAGLRGTGKTTLVWQLADHIYPRRHKDIYFFNVNTLKNLGIDLHTALEEFQRRIIKKRFNELSEPIALLFDEIHDDENWSKSLKILYDEARTAFILCTGSSALLLNNTADLARRMRIEKIYPYAFAEFIAAKTYSDNKEKFYPEKGLSDGLKEGLFYSQTAPEAFRKIKTFEAEVVAYFDKIKAVQTLELKALRQGYIRFQNIPGFLFYKDKYTINDGILNLLKRVILEDIPKLKPTFADYAKIEKLVLRLAGSDEINEEKLSGIIGVRQNDISALTDILSKAEIINLLLPFGGLDTKIAKNKKAFFMSPSLRSALLSALYGQELPEHFKSKLIEDIVVMYLRRVLTDGVVSFAAGSRANPDFVIETRDKPILLEVGTGKTSSKQIKASPIPRRYGLMASDGIRLPALTGNYIQIPFNWFLLL